MVLRGHVHNGMVLLDEPVTLPEGAAVRVEVVEQSAAPALSESKNINGGIEREIASIWRDLPPQAWAALPPDLSDNLDHFIYGTPRK